MNAIEILLNGLTPGSEASTWDSADSGAYTLTVDTEVIINVQERDGGDTISFWSSPGYLWDADWLRELHSPWSTQATGKGDEGQLRQTLSVSHTNGLVVLGRSWPRMQLDTVRFGQELARCVEVHRFWSGLLSQSPQVNADSAEY